MLRKILLSGIALTFMTGIANAESRSLPPSMIGTWCYVDKVDDKVDKKTDQYKRGRCDYGLRIAADAVGYNSGEDVSCDSRKIVPVNRGYEVQFKCQGEDLLWDQKATIWLDGRYLMYRVDRTYNERVDMGGCVVNDPTGTPLNVRKGPSSSAAILGALNNGTIVSTGTTQGNWVRVAPHEAPGKSGWVYKKYLECPDPPARRVKLPAEIKELTAPKEEKRVPTAEPKDDDMYAALQKFTCGGFRGVLWKQINGNGAFFRMYGTTPEDNKRFKVVDGEFFLDGKKCDLSAKEDER
jgi:Bacterial SH3 domain